MLSFRFPLGGLLLACAAILPPAAQAVVHVGPNCSLSSIQFALDTFPEETEFHIDVGTYAENLYINYASDPHDIKLIGGFVDCSDDVVVVDPTRTVINVSGSHQSAVAITGTVNPYFANLTLTGGEAPVGGAIRFEGTGWMYLRDVRVTGNAADKGGGIGIVPRDGPVVLNLNENTLVSGNTAATLGGGVYISGATWMLQGPSAAIAYNSVTADSTAGGGGGLAIVGPAHAHIGSTGFQDPASGVAYGAVSYNRGFSGAGIKLVDGGIVRLFSVDPNRPTVIEGNGDNTGPSYGGGIDARSGSTVCGWGYALLNNRGSGAALYAFESNVKLDRTSMTSCAGLGPETVQHADCAPDHACNTMKGNVGSAIVYSGRNNSSQSVTFSAGHVDVRDNSSDGYGLFYLAGSSASLYNCSIVDNDASTLFFQSYELTMSGCTIAGNRSTDPATPLNVLFAWQNVSLNLNNSIVWQPGAAILPRAPDSAVVADVLASDAAALAIGTHSHIIQADPLFVDDANGNYHLRRGSPAVDYSGTGSTTLDLELLPRCVPLVSDEHPCDVGAYELQEHIFASGFEASP